MRSELENIWEQMAMQSPERELRALAKPSV
jgi:hypothetical protein